MEADAANSRCVIALKDSTGKGDAAFSMKEGSQTSFSLSGKPFVSLNE